MAGFSGVASQYDLPNYVGDLFTITPADTPLLSLLGGLDQAEKSTSTTLQWQGYDLRTASQPAVLEGAPAPAGQERVRTNVTNVLQIHQEAVEVSYTKQGATGQHAGANIDGMNPVMDEETFQVEAALKTIGRDLEFSLINGTFQLPTDNTTARKTRGILSAIATNVTAAASAELTRDMVDILLQGIYTNGGIMESETATILVPPIQRRKLTRAYKTSGNYQERDRNVGGMTLTTIETDFGMLNVVTDRHMPTDTVAVVSLEELKLRFLEIPGKGLLFVEPLAKVGASVRDQLYCEVGLQYGNERAHGKITGLSVVNT